MNDKMKLEVGKHYRTRDGSKALINGRIGELISGRVETNEKNVISQMFWLESGLVSTNAGLPFPVLTNYDLVAEWTEPEAKKGPTLREMLAADPGSRVDWMRTEWIIAVLYKIVDEIEALKKQDAEREDAHIGTI